MSSVEEDVCSEDCPGPYSDYVEVIVSVAVTSVICLKLCCLEWTWRNRNLLSHYFEYCVVFTTGSILVAITVLSWPVNDSSLSCNLRPVLLAIGAGLMFGVFVSRIRKVWFNFVWLRRQPLIKMRRIIGSKRMKREPRIVLLLVLCLQLFLLSLNYIVPSFRPTCACAEYSREEGEYGSCSYSSTLGMLAILLNLFPLCLAAFYGYEILKEFRLSREEAEEKAAKAATSRTDRVNKVKSFNNASFSTIASGVSAKSSKSLRVKLGTTLLKSSSENAAARLSNLPIEPCEILGVRQDEVDEFRPIFISVSAVCFIGLLTVLISQLSDAVGKDRTRRRIVYFVRTFIILLSTTIPVLILYSRAYTLVSLKQEKTKTEEDYHLDEFETSNYGSGNKRKLTMTDRVVKVVASFRGTIPGDTPGPLSQKWMNKTNSSNQTSGGSASSFFLQFGHSLRQKLTSTSTTTVADKERQHFQESKLTEALSTDSTVGRVVKS